MFKSIYQSPLAAVREDVQLRLVARTTVDGDEWAGPCPLCGGTDRFRVWPNHGTGKLRYWCRQCNATGDIIDYLQRQRGMSFNEAKAMVEPPQQLQSGSHHKAKHPAGPGPGKERKLLAYTDDWQTHARPFVDVSCDALWSPVGEAALNYLRSRGLGDQILKEMQIGFNPTRRNQDWGSDVGTVFASRAIVIPCRVDGVVARIKLRRLGGNAASKYAQIRGGDPHALYSLRPIRPGDNVILLEGELDVVALMSALGERMQQLDLLPVATGGATMGRGHKAILNTASKVLVAMDSDDAGEEASQQWLEMLPNARRLRPTRKDLGEMVKAGDDVESWLLGGLDLNI